VTGSCEDGNELVGSIKDVVIAGQISDDQLLRRILLYEVNVSGVGIMKITNVMVHGKA
jgi:hypothetical protein